MPAPTVTRPAAATTSVAETPAHGDATATNQEWAKYAVWGLMALIALSVIGLATAYIITKTESSHTAKLQSEWDEYYSAMKDAKSDEERIEALEKLADNPKVKGTAVHAYALTSLARMNFEIALNPRKQPESRATAIDRAAKLYEMLAANEPFKSNAAFGPAAVQNLAAAYEQQQMSDPGTKYYDLGITALRSAMYKGDANEADPVPIKFFQTHYLFDRMNAQLGRIYWLRSLRKGELKKAEILAKHPEMAKLAEEQRKAEEAKDPKKAEEAKKAEDAVNADIAKESATVAKTDRDSALYFINLALNAGVSSVERERYGETFKGAWREEAAYIKSLIDANGQMLPNGTPPPAMKIEIEKKDDKAPAAGTSTAPRATEDAKKPDTAKKPDEAKKADDPKKAEDAKKPETKKDEPKKDETKKTGSNTSKSESAETASSEPSDELIRTPSQHLSYAQIQAMLKQGRSAMCQCPRCANSDKAIGAKLAE